MQLNERSDFVAGRGEEALRWTVDVYERAQRVRIQAGEQIRAIVQRRARSTTDERGAATADEILAAIRNGESDGPVPILGLNYRGNWEAEQQARLELAKLLPAHPVWPWLKHVRGVGPTLAARLLVRLDPHRASTPSGFWKYCGLATVQGVEYRCAVCGHVRAFPLGHAVTGEHSVPGRQRRCEGTLRRVRGPEEGVRVADHPAGGRRSPYDRKAKTICYLIGVSFLRGGGSYAGAYREKKAQLERERRGWSAGRVHLSALRKAQKLFLSHLWLVWREALGLPTTEPYATRAGDGGISISPWQMLGQPPPEPVERPYGEIRASRFSSAAAD